MYKLLNWNYQPLLLFIYSHTVWVNKRTHTFTLAISKPFPFGPHETIAYQKQKTHKPELNKTLSAPSSGISQQLFSHVPLVLFFRSAWKNIATYQFQPAVETATLNRTMSKRLTRLSPRADDFLWKMGELSNNTSPNQRAPFFRYISTEIIELNINSLREIERFPHKRPEED